MPPVSADLHVVFGAGQVGFPLAARLRAAGKRVRIAKRSSGDLPAGCEVALGDAADPAFCDEAARGAAVVYHCMNPPYDARIWADLIPRYMGNLIDASARTGARLVVLDNVYMLGRPRGLPLNEDTPVNPTSRKGEIRARAAERLFDAHRKGDVVAAAGRASDFYGPRGTQTALGDFFWPRALAGKTIYSPFSLDAVHTYHYIPDVASGLATLGCADVDAYGRPWMLPCVPAGTLREIVGRIAMKLGREIRLGQLPRRLLRVMALFMPLFREIDEMLYQWEEPFVIDDRQFRERFHVVPTDVDRAAADTLEWATRHYGRGTSRTT
ncbi:MAG TPA: NAD-dependent epimerase/dehydratase family protein [Vicinamibacterales bacterium]|nr:NAD-dependent epimerase/dehydratase family protein [Vicinamibacterales bacterium]